jgi:hypothetical protein
MVGTYPVKLLTDKSILFRLEALVNELGMCPTKKLPSNASVWRLGREVQRFGGTSPVRPLTARLRPMRVERFKMACGNLPAS